MKLLVDANLSPRVAKGLDAAGHQAIHVGDVGLLTASDDAIFEYAALNDQVILSADTDFGTLLARHNSARPYVCLATPRQRTDTRSTDRVVGRQSAGGHRRLG